MKQLIILYIVISFLISCKNQEENKPPIETQPNYFTFNGSIGTNDNSTLISKDSNLIFCCNFTGLSVLKITKSGKQIWQKNFGAGLGSSASGITETVSGELFICGTTSKNFSNSQSDVLLIKLNANGDTIWTKIYGGSESEYGTNIISTSDGNILVSGKTESFGAGSFGDIYLIKVNYNGDTLWTKTYPDQDQEVPFHLMETKNGEYLITGTNEDNSQNRELYLLKVSSDGTQLWNKKIGPPTYKWGYSSIELDNGDLVTCGSHPTNGYNQVLLIKTDKVGNIIWEKEYGENNLSEKGNSIKQNADGTFTITGSSRDSYSGLTNIILIKTDENGNQIWFKKFSSSSYSSGENLIKDTNDDNIITGYYNDNIFMTRIDNKGVYK